MNKAFIKDLQTAEDYLERAMRRQGIKGWWEDEILAIKKNLAKVRREAATGAYGDQNTPLFAQNRL